MNLYNKYRSNYVFYSKEPNTLHPRARLFTKTFHFETKNDFKDRLVRVYLPSTYKSEDENKRFPVIYMMDGKNLFDDYTSFVGEWGIDETIENFIEEKLCDGFIVVGVDAPNEDLGRSLEMSFDDIPTLKKYYRGEGYANIFADFIFNVVKPDIDRHFYTLSDRENTYFGGSSMGGLMAFYAATHYGDKIKAALCFSPAFFLLNQTELKKFLKTTLKKELPDLFLYVGNIGFESVFVKSTNMVNEFYNLNKPSLRKKFIFDKNMEHNEWAWRKYFIDALKFIINKE